MRIVIINGPNLNLLGTRETQIYGARSFESYLQEIRDKNADIQLGYFQSNIEGELVDFIQRCKDNYEAIILNAAAYSHTSLAIVDAIKAVQIPVIEVHISNIFAREKERQSSLLSATCIGVISGLGLNGYQLAIDHFKKIG